MIRTRSDLYNVTLRYEGYTNPLNGQQKHGRMLIDRDLNLAQFIENRPRLRCLRNHHLYGSLEEGLLLMQKPNGVCRLTIDFTWEGKNTWVKLQELFSVVYKVLKQSL